MQKHDNRLNRGTPRTQAGRTLEMRLRLQQAAYEVVAGGGLAALRIASVAKTAGVSQGAVLHHFPNKEALTFGALEQALILANSESSVWRLDAADPAQLLQGMVDDGWSWKHVDADGPNAPSHVRASVVGPQVLVPLKDGELALGTYQGIFFCEFDGPRTRKVFVTSLV